MSGDPADGEAPSPLDPFLAPFLEQVGTLTDGYVPGSHARSVASTLGWPQAFAEALFTSARARGLVEPMWSRGARGRNRWRLSRRGSTWLAARDAVVEQQPDEEAARRIPGNASTSSLADPDSGSAPHVSSG